MARAIVLQVPINIDRLYSESDPTYACFIRALLDEVEEVRVAINESVTG